MKSVRISDSYNLVKLDDMIKYKKEVIEEVRKDKPGLLLGPDRLNLDQGQTAAAVCSKNKLAAKWKERNIFLRQNKEILDIEL